MTQSLSTRLGSLGRTSQALAAVAAALDCKVTQARFDRAFSDLTISRRALHDELNRPIPEMGEKPRRGPFCCVGIGRPGCGRLFTISEDGDQVYEPPAGLDVEVKTLGFMCLGCLQLRDSTAPEAA